MKFLCTIFIILITTFDAYCQFFRKSGLQEMYIDMAEWESVENGNPVDGFTRTAWIAKQYDSNLFFQIEYNRHSNGYRSLVITNISLAKDINYKVLIGFDEDDKVFDNLNWTFNVGGMYQFPHVLIKDSDIPDDLISKVKSANTLFIVVQKESSLGFITDKTYSALLKSSTRSIDFVNSL